MLSRLSSVPVLHDTGSTISICDGDHEYIQQRSRIHWRTSSLDPVSMKDFDLRGISRDRWHHDIGIVNGKGQNRLKKQARHDESKHSKSIQNPSRHCFLHYISYAVSDP